jgi:WD domain, G-beta repeat.
MTYYVLLQIEGHDDDVNTVAFADSTSQILYSGGDDGLCKVYAMYSKFTSRLE